MTNDYIYQKFLIMLGQLKIVWSPFLLFCFGIVFFCLAFALALQHVAINCGRHSLRCASNGGRAREGFLQFHGLSFHLLKRANHSLGTAAPNVDIRCASKC